MTIAAHTRSTLNDFDLLVAQRKHLFRLEALFAGKELESVFILQGIQQYTEDDGPDWEAWLDRALQALAEQAAHAADLHVFRPLILNYNPRGVHFIDKMFGADTFRMDDGSWQVHPLEQPIGHLQAPCLDELPEWQMMKDFALAFRSRKVRGVTFALPTIASALNIAINLYGQDILTAMYDASEAARHDLAVINQVLCQVHQWYRANLPEEQTQCIVPDGRYQPPGYGQLCGCSTHLLSPRLYRDFVAPLDAALLSVYPHGGMIHLCGDHDHHIPTWNVMTALRSVQMNDRATADLEAYFYGLRPDQMLYVHACKEMPVEDALRITHGRRLVLVADVREPIALPL